MPARKQTATAQLKTRLREPLRAQLESSAKRRGVTLNAEIVDRLERSLQQEARFSGPELERFALGLINIFEARGKPKGSAKDDHTWMREKEPYLRGIMGIVEGLCYQMPDDVTSREITLATEEMWGRMFSYVAGRAANS